MKTTLTPYRSRQIQFKKRRRLMCIASAMLIIVAFSIKSDARKLTPAPIVQAQEQPSEITYNFNPCDLQDVYCDNESMNVPKGKIVIATITTYQAKVGQTDSTPCIGAMPHVNFCDPPFPIVAANGYPLGTKVMIKGIIYTIADRMNKRYGPDHFDILTYESNYSLLNEPVTILTNI
jgi:hypothetical protein